MRFYVIARLSPSKCIMSLDLNTSVELILKIEAKMQIGKYH